MNNTKLRAWDDHNQTMIYSEEEDTIFYLEAGKWSVRYTREKTYYRDGIEIDAPFELQSCEIEVMQASGKKDFSGKEIYAGDKCKVGGVCGIVEYSETLCKFFFKGPGFTTALGTWAAKDIEVVGNVYENANLLIHSKTI